MRPLWITNHQPHNAAADATATGEVLHKLLRVAAEAGHIDLGHLQVTGGGTTTRPLAGQLAQAAYRPRAQA